MHDEHLRRRLVSVLFAANGLSSTSFIGAVTVAPIIAAELAGTPGVAGLPSTAATVGTAAGALGLGWLGARSGRRPSFALGFGVAAIGSLLGLLAGMAGSFVLFSAALFVLGFGRSVSQLARYAAGDLRDEGRRGGAISLIVWASTIGAVVGPILIAPAGDVAAGLGVEAMLGPLGLAGVGFAIAAIVIAVLLRPEPLTLAVTTAADARESHTARMPLREVMNRPTVLLSLVVLVISQLVMVLVMTMTPLHIRDAGDDLRTVGWVMMAHTIGMFAFAPITGALVDRMGTQRMMGAGAIVLVVSCAVAATATGGQTVILVLSLLGLGVGWSFGFISASTHLQRGLGVVDRVRVQGVADATTWMSGALGAALSGVVVAGASYGVLAASGAVLALAIPAALTRLRTPVPAPA